MPRNGFRLLPAAVLLLMLFLLPLGLCSAAEEAPAQFAEIPVLRLTAACPLTDSPSAAGTVSWWYCDWEDCRFLFLPAAADRTHITLQYTLADDAEALPLALNGATIENGAETDILSTADTFSVTLGETACGTLRVMQSNLGSIWVSAEDEALSLLDADKANTVSGNVLMLDARGAVQYDGALESLHGRGNSSWLYSIKKPYNFKLPQKAALYGMEPAKKWALLGNYLDQSMLRNEIAFAMSRQAGIPFTTDAVFVDLYLNGSYRGTYQLCERVLVNPGRVAIRDLQDETALLNALPLRSYERIIANGTENGEEPESYRYYDIPNDPEDITGGYLFQFQLAHRAEKAAFTTARGQICEITAPEYPTKAQTEYLRGFVQELEDAIFAEDGCSGSGKHYSEYLDVDSLLLGYLMQEITENADGATTSFFFWKDSDLTGDGKLHYGPVWDFDLAFMNYSIAIPDAIGNLHYSFMTDDLYAVYSGCRPASEDAPAREGWLWRLWKQDEIALRTAVLYEERFDGFLTELTEPESGLIAGMHDALLPAAEMNNARWHMFGGHPYKTLGPNTGESFTECTDYVRRFLVTRQAFLHRFFPNVARLRAAGLTEAAFAVHDAAEYDPAEQSARADLLAETQAKIAAAETAAEAAEIEKSAEQALAEIPRTALWGDFSCDGAVDLDDAQLLLIYYTEDISGLSPYADATQRRNGDTDENGALDLNDAMRILDYYTEKLTAI